MCLSGAANGAGTAANGTMGTAPTPGIAAAVTAAADALSGGGAAAFSSILRLLNLLPATVRDGAAGVRPLGGPRAAPVRRRAARAWSAGGVGACQGPWRFQQRSRGAAMPFRSRFSRVVQLVACPKV